MRYADGKPLLKTVTGLRNRVSLDHLCHPTKIIIETRFLGCLEINLMVRYGAEKKLLVMLPR